MAQTTIRVGNSVCRVETTDRRMIHILDQALAVEVQGAFFARQHRPNWDGRWHPVDVIRGTFPTGLLAKAKTILPVARIEDERIRPAVIPFKKDILQGVELADHQCNAIKLALEAGNGVIATSVASGKTEQGIAVACHVMGRCVWITHRKDIFYQTAERIKWRTGETAAMIGDGSWDDVKDQKFVIAMPQTALMELRTFGYAIEDAAVLIIDEAHTTSAAHTWYQVAQLVPAYFRIGLTGSPDTGDPVRDMRLEASTGPILIRIRAKEMADIGWVVPAEVYYHKMNNPPLHGVDYRDARRMLIEENPDRNAMIVQLAMDSAREGKRCLVICDTIKHVRIIAEVLSGENVRSKVLTGHASGKARVEAKKDFRSGVTEIMITTPVWDLGVDVPEIETVILAAGGKSAVRVIQRVGRALRRSPGKDKAIIHDFIDTGSSYTMRHSMARIKACRTEGFEVKGDFTRPSAISAAPAPEQ